MIFRLTLLFLYFSFYTLTFTYANQDTISISIDSTAIKQYTDYSFNATEDSAITPDTSLTAFQNYNPVYNSLYYNLGNLGLAHNSFLIPQTMSIGFDYGQHNLDLYQFNGRKINYYNTKKPYTELNVVLGSKKEQYFRLVHTQNIKENWNFGVNMNKIRSDGFYQKQATNTTGLVFHTNYLAKTKKYGILANGVYNKLTLEENGGIQDDSHFENFEGVSSNTIPVNLEDAKNTQNNKSIYIKQYYNVSFEDSLNNNDSLYKKEYSLIQGGFSHSLLLNKNIFVYVDNNPANGYYKNIFLDSTKTIDSSNYTLLENELCWSNYNSPILYSFSGKHQYIKTNQINRDSIFEAHSYENIIIGAEIKKGNRLKYFWKASANYVLKGINSEDYKSVLNWDKFLNNNYGEISLEGSIQKRSPDYILKNYFSNHFEWNNNFSKTNYVFGNIEYKVSKRLFKIGFSFSDIYNYIYFDTAARPQQLSERIQVFNGCLQKDFKIKSWHLNNLLVYQKVDGPNVIRIPEIVSKHSLFYENNLFKKALYMQIGIDVFYFSEYLGNSYMPATLQFHLQNEKKIGNYPYLDFFINFKVKQVRAFLKAEHFNAGLMGNNYYMVPHYPMPGRAFKFGVSWIFFD